MMANEEAIPVEEQNDGCCKTLWNFQNKSDGQSPANTADTAPVIRNLGVKQGDISLVWTVSRGVTLHVHS